MTPSYKVNRSFEWRRVPFTSKQICICFHVCDIHLNLTFQNFLTIIKFFQPKYKKKSVCHRSACEICLLSGWLHMLRHQSSEEKINRPNQNVPKDRSTKVKKKHVKYSFLIIICFLGCVCSHQASLNPLPQAERGMNSNSQSTESSFPGKTFHSVICVHLISDTTNLQCKKRVFFGNVKAATANYTFYFLGELNETTIFIKLLENKPLTTTLILQ